MQLRQRRNINSIRTRITDIHGSNRHRDYEQNNTTIHMRIHSSVFNAQHTHSHTRTAATHIHSSRICRNVKWRENAFVLSASRIRAGVPKMYGETENTQKLKIHVNKKANDRHKHVRNGNVAFEHTDMHTYTHREARYGAFFQCISVERCFYCLYTFRLRSNRPQCVSKWDARISPD